MLANELPKAGHTLYSKSSKAETDTLANERPEVNNNQKLFLEVAP
jgi:hypothetical protein